MTNTETMTTLTCTKCASDFSITSKFCRTWREGVDTTLWCPCCGTSWAGGSESPAKKLQKQLDAEYAAHAKTRAALNTSKRQLTAKKGAITKLNKRIGNGVCPCCNRTFVNVQRHMASKHPELKDRQG